MQVAALPAALADPEAVVWVDMPDLDEESLGVLRDAFGFHPVTIWECRQRQRMPKFHPYADHLFVVLHSPELGEHGHVHDVELDQFIGPNYLVTVHGPTNPAVPAHVLRCGTRPWCGSASRKAASSPAQRCRCPMRSSHRWSAAWRRPSKSSRRTLLGPRAGRDPGLDG